MANLSSPRRLVTSLIFSIASSSTAQHNQDTSNPLKDASPETQKALLTFHVLFPNELLPALDLLDRGLVTRFTLQESQTPMDDTLPAEEVSSTLKPTAVYYVRSAQPQTRHRSAVAHTTSYEVRLEAWSCSCPAFAFAAFPAMAAESSTAVESAEQGDDAASGEGWKFGGLTRGSSMPACKHLLACVLVEHCSAFRGFATEQEVSIDELAGWAAGWGD